MYKKHVKRVKGYSNLLLLLGVALNLVAFSLGIKNKEQMFLGYEFIIITAIIILIVIWFFSNIQPRMNMNILLMGVLLPILFCNTAVIRTIVAGQWNVPQKSYTTLSYFSNTGGRNLENMAEKYDSYAVEWAVIFHDIFSEKKVFIDKDVIEEPILLPLIEGTDYIEADKKYIYSSTDIKKMVDRYSAQNIWGETEDGRIVEWHLLTGSMWEQSKSIHIINDGNKILALPTQLYDQIDKSESTEVNRNKVQIESVRMSFHMDETICRVYGEGKYKLQLAAKNFLFMCFIFISGLIPLLFMENRKCNIDLLFFLAFPTGTVVQILLIFSLSILGMLKNVWIILVTEFVIEGVLLAVLWKKNHWKKVYELSQKKNIALLGVLLGIILFFSLVPNVFLTYDSYCNILIGKQMVINEGCKEILGRLIMFSLVSTNLQAEASLFGIPLNYAFQPVFTVTGIGLILYLQRELLMHKGLKEKDAWILSIILGSVFVVTPQFILGSWWILNNLTIGIWYAAALGCLEIYVLNKSKLLLFVSVFFFAVTGIARIEGGVFAVIYLVVLYTTEAVSKTFSRKVSLGFTFLYGMLFFIYCMMIENIENGFWTPQNGGMSLALLIVFDIYIVCSMSIKKDIFKLYNRLNVVMCIVLIAANFVMGLYDGAKFMLTMQNFLINIMSTGYYGISLSVGIGALALRILYAANPKTGVKLMNISISYVLLIVLMMQLSINNTRIGYGDSACRMFLHIIPTIGLGITTCFGETFEVQRGNIYEKKYYE